MCVCVCVCGGGGSLRHLSTCKIGSAVSIGEDWLVELYGTPVDPKDGVVQVKSWNVSLPLHNLLHRCIHAIAHLGSLWPSHPLPPSSHIGAPKVFLLTRLQCFHFLTLSLPFVTPPPEAQVCVEYSFVFFLFVFFAKALLLLCPLFTPYLHKQQRNTIVSPSLGYSTTVFLNNPVLSKGYEVITFYLLCFGPFLC